MFILVLMLRHCITKLREFGVIMVLPLDEHIKFHKVTGRLMFIYSLVHSLAHLGNIGEYSAVLERWVQALQRCLD